MHAGVEGLRRTRQRVEWRWRASGVEGHRGMGRGKGKHRAREGARVTLERRCVEEGELAEQVSGLISGIGKESRGRKRNPSDTM